MKTPGRCLNTPPPLRKCQRAGGPWSKSVLSLAIPFFGASRGFLVRLSRHRARGVSSLGFRQPLASSLPLVGALRFFKHVFQTRLQHYKTDPSGVMDGFAVSRVVECRCRRKVRPAPGRSARLGVGARSRHSGAGGHQGRPGGRISCRYPRPSRSPHPRSRATRQCGYVVNEEGVVDYQYAQ